MITDIPVPPAVEGAVTPMPQFDRLFAPHAEGYLGADAALSIPLGDGRVFWAFGDTLMGEVKNGARQIRAMPRNTVAIQHPGTPDPGRIEWVLYNDQGDPATFLNLPSHRKDQWFWPGTGICIEGQLFLFGYAVTHGKGECEALSFRVLDGWMLRVRDTKGHPSTWRFEALPMPYPAGGAYFSSANYYKPPFLYLLGVGWNPSGSQRRTHAALARARMDDLLAGGNQCPFEFLCRSNGTTPDWSDTADSLAKLYEPGVTECSIHYDTPRRRFVATTYLGRSPEFFVTTAPELTGPWTPPAEIFRAYIGEGPEYHLSYAMRMHPHLAQSPDEMILTYVVNPRTLSGVAADTQYYYPRFLKLDLTRI